MPGDQLRNQSGLQYLRRILTLALFCFVLAGCTVRPAESPEIRALLPIEAVDVHAVQANPDSVKPDISDKGVVSILALSGGGAEGAFGAGVLNGWSQSGSRPKFDIVTGVSTGALMATLAFLGPEYDRTLEHIYTTQTNEKIFRERGAAGLLSDSLYDIGPLKQQIEDHVDAVLVAKIAAEHKKGRRLYVATTNLDAGELVVWDMGAIAVGNRFNPVQMFQKVLRASTAIPGFFQPVYIKPKKGVQLRQAHVDGGVKAPVLLSDFLFRSPAKKRELYVIINDQLRLRSEHTAVKGELADIARKSIFELMRELLYNTVYQGYVRSRNSGTTFGLLAIPDSFPASTKSLDFDPKRMRALFSLGQKLGRSRSFSKEPPRLQKFDRVVRR
ncbi:MAG: patatin-like phospholipase family protein [Pseudomonadota bacterium]